MGRYTNIIDSTSTADTTSIGTHAAINNAFLIFYV